jgi:hypothetical protein
MGTEPNPRERAEDELRRLAAAVGPLRRVLAAIAERLIATKAFERLCYARLGDYARERPGVSARQLQELARVHRALAELPAVERALVRNELPWSKVRLVARVATPADEAAWIARARSIATRRLEREVREIGGADPEDPEAGPTTRVSLRCTPAVREKWSLARELAERQAGQSLTAEEALEWMVAEAFSALSIGSAALESLDGSPGTQRGDERESPDSDVGEANPGVREAVSARRAPARELPHAVASLVDGLEAADAFELDGRLRRAMALEQTLDAAMAPLLRVVACAEYEWEGDWQRLSDYACDQLGMSASKARALRRLDRAGEVCPELRDAFQSGRLSWVKAHLLLPLLLLDLPGEWRASWVAWGERVTVRRLAADVERALLLRAGHHLAWQRCKFDPERARDPIPSDERQLCAPDIDTEATQELVWRLPLDVAALFSAVSMTLRARPGSGGRGFATEGEAFDRLLDCALLTWTLLDPDARRPDPVIERDGYSCAVPGCTSRRNLHDHHIWFRSACGSDEAWNRITLCAFHHHRFLHAGLLRVRGRAPDELVFELGVRPGAPALVRYRSGDIALPADEVAGGSADRRRAA